MSDVERILIVEDERNIALGMLYNFEKRGYHVKLVDRGDVALETALSSSFDLIILDVMLPGLSGFDVCKGIREKGIHTPVLMLTARGEIENRIKGIRLGADDYLPKPFELEELIARAQALIRRRHWDLAPSAPKVYQLGSECEIEFDVDQLALRNKQRSIALTSIESRLLQSLLNEQGRPVSRAQLLERVWGLHKETQTRTLDNFIMRLRHHFSELGGSPEWIESVRGVGYRFKKQDGEKE